MNPQISAIISLEKEKELFEYISDVCECFIYRPYSNDNDFIYNNTDIGLPKYLFLPKTKRIEFDIQSCPAEMPEYKHAIIPFDEYASYHPFVEYDRFDGNIRVYANIGNMSPENKSLVKPVFDMIKKWIKKNSTSKKKFGIAFSVYVVE